MKREKDKSTAGILIISKSINNGNYNYCGLPLGEDFSDKFDGSAMDSIAGKGIYEQSFLFDQFLISLNAMDFYQKSAINNAIFDFFTQYYLRSINKK